MSWPCDVRRTYYSTSDSCYYLQDAGILRTQPANLSSVTVIISINLKWLHFGCNWIQILSSKWNLVRAADALADLVSGMEDPKEPNGRDGSEGESVSLSPNLPSPPAVPHQAAQQSHRTTNFFIDNILRPDFGCKKEFAGRERAHTSDRENVNPLIIRPSLPATLCQDSNCSNDSTSSSSLSSLPPSKQNSSTRGEGNGSNSIKCGENTASIMVVNADNGRTAPVTDPQPLLWPAWVYCTRYSDRPSSGKAEVA